MAYYLLNLEAYNNYRKKISINETLSKYYIYY